MDQLKVMFPARDRLVGGYRRMVSCLVDRLADMPHFLLLAGSVAHGVAGGRSDLDLFCVLATHEDRELLATRCRLRTPENPFRFEIVRAAIEWNQIRASLRMCTVETVSAMFADISKPMYVWRDSPTAAVTANLEVRINRAGSRTVHPWCETPAAGGFVRRLVRLDSRAFEPVATTETSMLISGHILSARDITDSIRIPVWESFGLPSNLADVLKHPLFSALADPRTPRGKIQNVQ